MLFLSGERARQSGTGTGTGPESSSLPNDRVTLVTIWTYLERRRLVLLEEEVLVGSGTWMIRRRPVGGRTEGRKGRSEQCVSSVQPSSEYPAPTSEDSREIERGSSVFRVRNQGTYSDPSESVAAQQRSQQVPPGVFGPQVPFPPPHRIGQRGYIRCDERWHDSYQRSKLK